MNAITLIWKQVLKELKLFQTKGNKEDAGEKTDKELQKTLNVMKTNMPFPCRTLHCLLEEKKRKRQNENNRSD